MIRGERVEGEVERVEGEEWRKRKCAGVKGKSGSDERRQLYSF